MNADVAVKPGSGRIICRRQGRRLCVKEPLMEKSAGSEKLIKTAFILGAGLGTRLMPLTRECPKPLLPLGGRPIITYAMDHLRQSGIERFIVNTHHRAEVYEQVFPGHAWRGVPIIFRHEPDLLDTGGGLKNIEDLLDEGETLMVYNGDILTDIPLVELVDHHFRAGKEATLALRSNGNPRNVNLDAAGAICDFRQVLGNPGVGACLFTGVYIIEKSLLKRLKPGAKQDIITVFIEMIREEPGAVAGVVIDAGQWNDIGTPEIYEGLNEAQ
jgi:mannose-1-phosphate guanylyltransferase